MGRHTVVTTSSRQSGAQKIVFLGVLIDTVKLRAYPSDQRLDKVFARLEPFLASPELPMWEWLPLLGHMATLEKLVFHARACMRTLQFHLRAYCMEPIQKYCKVPISSGCSWWNDQSWMSAGVSLETATPDFFLYSDASKEGWGASVDHLQTHGLWTLMEAKEHINVLELEAVVRGLKEFRQYLAHANICVMSDNNVPTHRPHTSGSEQSSEGSSGSDLDCAILAQRRVVAGPPINADEEAKGTTMVEPSTQTTPPKGVPLATTGLETVIQSLQAKGFSEESHPAHRSRWAKGRHFHTVPSQVGGILGLVQCKADQSTLCHCWHSSQFPDVSVSRETVHCLDNQRLQIGPVTGLHSLWCRPDERQEHLLIDQNDGGAEAGRDVPFLGLEAPNEGPIRTNAKSGPQNT